MQPNIIDTLFPQVNQIRQQAQDTSGQLEDAIKTHLAMQAALVIIGISILVLLSRKN